MQPAQHMIRSTPFQQVSGVGEYSYAYVVPQLDFQ
jgi:hypothetical protein